ncbi:MAG: Nitrogen regulatory protein P-II, partial [uncultured Acetobacteraceae bacterium]
EEDRGHHQALQTRRGEGRPARDRAPRPHGGRSQGLRAAEGPHGAVPGRRVRRGLPAQGEDRAGRRRRPGGPRHRGDPAGGAHGSHRRRQDLRHRHPGRDPHPHRRTGRGRGV